MKKRIIFAILAALFSLSACMIPSAEFKAQWEISSIPPQITQKPEPSKSPISLPSSTEMPAQSTELPSAEKTMRPEAELPLTLDSMLPIFDSIIRTEAEFEIPYSAEPSFIWPALYELSSIWGYEYETGFDGGNISVSSDLMLLFASALSSEVTELPDFPEGFDFVILSNSDYVLKIRDMGSTYSEIKEFISNRDGTVSAEVHFLDKNIDTASIYIFTCVVNDDAYSPFYYAVKSFLKK